MKNKSKLFLVGIIIAAVGVVTLIAALAGGESGRDALVGAVMILVVGLVLGVIGFFKKPAPKKQPAPAKAENPDLEGGAEDDEEASAPSKYKFNRPKMYSKNAVTEFRTKHPVYIALGIATTGTDYDGDKIVDIALLRVENGAVVKQFRTFVNPGMPIPPAASAANGITAADVSGAPSFAEIAPAVLGFAGDLPIVANYATFNACFMKRALADFAAHHDYIDVVKMATHKAPELPDIKLQTVASRFGVECKYPRNALDNAVTAHALFEKLCVEYLK